MLICSVWWKTAKGFCVSPSFGFPSLTLSSLLIFWEADRQLYQLLIENLLPSWYQFSWGCSVPSLTRPILGTVPTTRRLLYPGSVKWEEVKGRMEQRRDERNEGMEGELCSSEAQQLLSPSASQAQWQSEGTRGQIVKNRADNTGWGLVHGTVKCDIKKTNETNILRDFGQIRLSCEKIWHLKENFARICGQLWCLWCHFICTEMFSTLL